MSVVPWQTGSSTAIIKLTPECGQKLRAGNKIQMLKKSQRGRLGFSAKARPRYFSVWRQYRRPPPDLSPVRARSAGCCQEASQRGFLSPARQLVNCCRICSVSPPHPLQQLQYCSRSNCFSLTRFTTRKDKRGGAPPQLQPLMFYICSSCLFIHNISLVW